MGNAEDKIEEQIYDFLTGEASAEEIEALERWLAASGEEGKSRFKACVRRFYAVRWAGQEVKAEGRVLELGGVSVRRVKRSIRLRRWAVAATVAVLAGAGLAGWLLRGGGEEVTYVVKQYPVLIDDTRPVLKMEDGRQIVLPADAKTIREDAKGRIAMADSSLLEYRLAGTGADTAVVFHTLEVPRGCEFQVLLADGTRVWLNAASRLRYPGRFVGDRREVYLEGEGYFEVAKDERAPFVVHAQEMELTVLGTSFDIRAYGEERSVVTTLFTGRVEQSFAGVGGEVELVPSQRSVFNREGQTVKTERADVREALAWKEGKIVARNERLEDIFVMLSRWYDFEVRYTRPELKDMRFHLHTNRYKTIREVLDNLMATKGIQVDYFEDIIYIR